MSSLQFQCLNQSYCDTGLGSHTECNCDECIIENCINEETYTVHFAFDIGEEFKEAILDLSGSDTLAVELSTDDDAIETVETLEELPQENIDEAIVIKAELNMNLNATDDYLTYPHDFEASRNDLLLTNKECNMFFNSNENIFFSGESFKDKTDKNSVNELQCFNNSEFNVKTPFDYQNSIFNPIYSSFDPFCQVSNKNDLSHFQEQSYLTEKTMNVDYNPSSEPIINVFENEMTDDEICAQIRRDLRKSQKMSITRKVRTINHRITTMKYMTRKRHRRLLYSAKLFVRDIKSSRFYFTMKVKAKREENCKSFDKKKSRFYFLGRIHLTIRKLFQKRKSSANNISSFCGTEESPPHKDVVIENMSFVFTNDDDLEKVNGNTVELVNDNIVNLKEQDCLSVENTNWPMRSCQKLNTPRNGRESLNRSLILKSAWKMHEACRRSLRENRSNSITSTSCLLTNMEHEDLSTR